HADSHIDLHSFPPRRSSDLTHPEQITSDDYNNWFPHPSPDGKWIVFLSYEKEVQGHPENKDVMLRLLALNGGQIRPLAKLFGGQDRKSTRLNSSHDQTSYAV